MIDSIHRALIFVFATRLVLGLFKSRADASADPCFSFWFLVPFLSAQSDPCRAHSKSLILVQLTLQLLL
jgi:hypothetical protein